MSGRSTTAILEAVIEAVPVPEGQSGLTVTAGSTTCERHWPG